MIVKVKEPQPGERAMLRAGRIPVHLSAFGGGQTADAGSAAQRRHLHAYETIGGAGGGLPLLAPMSAVAERLSVQAGATCLEKSAAGVACYWVWCAWGDAGAGGDPRCRRGWQPCGNHCCRHGGAGYRAGSQSGCAASYPAAIRQPAADHVPTAEAIAFTAVRNADLLIGGILILGRLRRSGTREMVKSMPDGAAIVDVAIDQGGCCQTSRPTTHADPVYLDEGVVHYW